MATIRSALVSSVLLIACASPSGREDGDATATANTIGSESTTGSITEEDDATADPTTFDSGDVATADDTSATCTDAGCPCRTALECDPELVCRENVCQPTVCGDGTIEGDELCDDENSVDGDGCDADCSYTEIVQVEVSYRRTCVVLEGGRVRCWGANGNGELGQGNTEDLGDDEAASEVEDILLPDDASAVSSGDYHTCALLGPVGDAICWGSGGSGQLGQVAVDDLGDDEFPSALPSIMVGGAIAQLRAGGTHTCARLANGTVRCWGAAFSGQLGYGNLEAIGDDEPPSRAGSVPIGSAVDLVSAGINHTCAILAGGHVRCWGSGSTGALGYGNDVSIGDDETPESVAALDFGEDAVDISCGLVQSCAVFESGTVRCWGRNSNGELGLGHTTDIGDDEPATTLAPIDLGGTATAVSVGDNHACAVLDDGSVRCWGSNAVGELGLGHTMNVGDDEPPSRVAALEIDGSQPNQVDAGGSHTCVILDRRRLRCWGSAANGELGHGNTDTLGDDEAIADIPDVPLFAET